MSAITGIAAKVGGEVARNLLAGNQPIRAVVRDLRKSEAWAHLGCDLVPARTNGYLKRCYVDIGARVRKGELLAAPSRNIHTTRKARREAVVSPVICQKSKRQLRT